MSARPAQLAGNAAGIQKQVPFTPDDERTIVAFLVAVNPDGKHRNGQQLWKVLEANAGDKWPGGPRHSAVSWRNYYIKNADRFDTWVARIVQEEKPSSDASDEGGGTRLKRRKLLHRPHRPVAGTSRSRAPDHGVDDDTNLFSTAHPSLGISAHPHSNVVQDTAVPSAHDEADTPATNLYPRLPAPLSALGLTGVLTTDQKLSSDSDPEPTLPPKPPVSASNQSDTDSDPEPIPHTDHPSTLADKANIQRHVLRHPIPNHRYSPSAISTSAVSHTSRQAADTKKRKRRHAVLSPIQSQMDPDEMPTPSLQKQVFYSPNQDATRTDADGAAPKAGGDNDSLFDAYGEADSVAPAHHPPAVEASSVKSNNANAQLDADTGATPVLPAAVTAKPLSRSPPRLAEYEVARKQKIFATASSMAINAALLPRPVSRPLLPARVGQFDSLSARRLAEDLSRVAAAVAAVSVPAPAAAPAPTLAPAPAPQPKKHTEPVQASSPFFNGKEKHGRLSGQRIRKSIAFRPEPVDGEYALRGPDIVDNDSSQNITPTRLRSNPSSDALKPILRAHNSNDGVPVDDIDTAKRRQTFGGFAAPVTAPPKHQLIPHAEVTERALRRMSANHGFAPSIVRGVWAGSGGGLDFGLTDTVLARMRLAAEREAERALADATGDEFEVERSSLFVDAGTAAEGDGLREQQQEQAQDWVHIQKSPLPLQQQLSVDGDWDLADVPEVDFSRRRSTSRRSKGKGSSLAHALPPESSPSSKEHVWTAAEDQAVLNGSPIRLYDQLEARHGPTALMARLAVLLRA